MKGALKGLGIDIVDIDKFKRTIGGKTGKSFIDINFTKAEFAYAVSIVKPFCPLSLAATFAAKEATYKAFGTGWIEGRGVEVLHKKSSAPQIALHGEIQEIAKKRKIEEVLVSLSYTDLNAVAVVLLV
jgi:holo-[acyl-carrier protein] synthase